MAIKHNELRSIQILKGISASITLELIISNKKIYFKSGKLKSEVKHFEVEEILK